MINIGDQLYVNEKWFWDVIGITNDMAIIQIYYIFGYPKPQITRKSFKYPIKDIFIESESMYKNTSIDENKLRKVIGNLIDQILIQDNILESIILEDGSGTAAVSTSSSTGMGAVTSPGISCTPGVPGTSGSDVAVGGKFLGASSPNGFNFIKKYKKRKKTDKKTENFDFEAYNNSQKDKGIIDTRFSKRHIIDMINMGKSLNHKIESEMFTGKKYNNIVKPLGIANYSESVGSIATLNEDEYKTKLIEFISRPYSEEADSTFSNEININKESIINNPVVKIKAYLNRFKNANIEVFNSTSDDFKTTYNLFSE